MHRDFSTFFLFQNKNTNEKSEKRGKKKSEFPNIKFGAVPS